MALYVKVGFFATCGLRAALGAATLVLVSSSSVVAQGQNSQPKASVTGAAGTAQLLASTNAKPATPPRLSIDSFADEPQTRETAGFRMEGAPQLDVLFGDIAHYKQHIDRYRDLHKQMEASHARFAKASHEVQQALAAERNVRRICPRDAIASSYATASESGLLFRRLGADLETTFLVIRELDELGESAGLTPDYRWHVRSSKRVYKRALVDLREMRATFKSQVDAEARAHGCKSEDLLTRAQELRGARELAVVKPSSAGSSAEESVMSSTATFFVNNADCRDAVRVFVDNTLLGEVAPKSRAAFQSLSGRHSICILATDDTRTCGDSETVRTAFIHDGFAMSRSCTTSLP